MRDLRMMGSVGIALATLSILACPLAGQKPSPIDWAKVQDEAVRILSAYLQIDTTVPPGDTRKAAEYLKGILEQEGIEVQLFESVPGKANLLARLKGGGTGGKPLLLLNHMDVVPADPAKWAVPPFSGIIREGYVWGRGALDMKGVGIAELMALLLLKRQGVPLKRDLLFLAVADEEVGGALGAGWMVEHHWTELDPEYVIDEGGLGSRGLLTPDGRPVFGISVAQKKVFWQNLVAEGVGGHGSQPHPENPNHVLVHALSRLIAYEPPVKETALLVEMKKRLGPLAENKFTHAIQRNTVSLTTLRAGVGEPPKINVIPSRVMAGLDSRLLPDEDPQAWRATLEEVMGKELFVGGRLRWEAIQEPEAAPVAPMDSELFRLMERTITRMVPGAVVTPLLIPWGTDSRFFLQHGARAYGLVPFILSLEELARIHADDERVSVENLGLGSRLFYEVALALCRR